MNTLDTMKQALEALNYLQGIVDTERGPKAAEALRQVIADMEAQEPVAWMTINEYGEEDDIHYENPEGHLLEGWTYKPLYTTPQPKREPVLLRRGDILRCIETDELCTVWATSTTGKTLVHWGGNDFTDYTAEQIGDLFWVEPRAKDLEDAAERSDSYAAFHAGFRFAQTQTSKLTPEIKSAYQKSFEHVSAQLKAEQELKMCTDYTLAQLNVGIGERATEAYEAAKKRGWSGVSDERLMEMPKQEPVALEAVYETIIHWDEGGGKRSRRELARRIVDLYTHPQPKAEPVIDESAAKRIATALGWEPKRGWVGLTDEEANELWESTDTQDDWELLKRVETKLKEKNG